MLTYECWCEEVNDLIENNRILNLISSFAFIPNTSQAPV